MPKAIVSDPQKILVTGNVIFLYGYIGDATGEPEAQVNENRDIDFVVQLENLCKTYGSVEVRINSNGGSVRHGSAMISAIQRHEDKVATYNDGMCASIAADIWMAAKNRYMAENAMVMIHAPSGGCYGTAQEIRKYADNLEELAQGTIELMAEATGKTSQEIKASFYDGEDHFLTAKQCVELGLLTVENANYEAETPPITEGDTTQKYFADLQTRMAAHLEEVAKELITKNFKKDDDMEFSDLMKKLMAGECSPEELAQIKAAQEAAQAKADASKTYTQADLEAATSAATKAQEDKIKALEADVVKLRAGAEPTPPVAKGVLEGKDGLDLPLPEGGLSEAEKSLMEVNRQIAGGARYDQD